MICILQYRFHYGTESVILKVLFSLVIAQYGLLTWISTVESSSFLNKLAKAVTGGVL